MGLDKVKKLLLPFLIIILIISIIMTLLYASEIYSWINNYIDYTIHGKIYFSKLEKITFNNLNLEFINLNELVYERNKSSTLKFLGAFIAGIIALITIVLSFKRFNQTQDQINKSEENNLNTTFKDAVTLLGNDNVSVRMGGVYTLIDIAKKTVNTNNSYVERISDILCNYIVDQTNIKSSEYNKRHIRELVDLVIIKNNKTFKNQLKDLSNATFIDIKFGNKERIYIYNIRFAHSQFIDCSFISLSLINCKFIDCRIGRKSLSFKSCYFNNCYFINNFSTKNPECLAFKNSSSLINCTFKIPFISYYVDTELYYDDTELLDPDIETICGGNCIYFDICSIDKSTFSFSDNLSIEDIESFINSINFKIITLKNCTFKFVDRLFNIKNKNISIDKAIGFEIHKDILTNLDNIKFYYDKSNKKNIESQIKSLLKNIKIKDNIYYNDKLLNFKKKTKDIGN